jgi:antitoxin (DNA-binding transcriptional repressor) of toxin-antitoxin stability system
MKASANHARRRIAATDARIHFGELLDEVADSRKSVEVERDDGFVAVLAPAEEDQPVAGAFDAASWLANLKRIHDEMREYRAANPITETPEDIIRELRESR